MTGRKTRQNQSYMIAKLIVSRYFSSAIPAGALMSVSCSVKSLAVTLMIGCKPSC